MSTRPPPDPGPHPTGGVRAETAGAGLDNVRELGVHEHGLAVAITLRPTGLPRASVVNAGVIDHPVTGEHVVAFVSRGTARKLDDLRHRPNTTVVLRSDWDWIAVEGTAQLAGPDDDLAGLANEDLPAKLRAIYAAAVGGTPDDWARLDETMAAERHTAVLVSVTRLYTNPASGDRASTTR